MNSKWFFIFVMLFIAALARGFASDLNCRYQLLEGSSLRDDCLICDPVTPTIPMRGSFNLRRIEATPIATRYVDTDAQTGSVFKKNSDLLAQFHPSTNVDYGLDAFYIWPTGEIWFSTATGFTDNELGTISDGDLLSDAGYIVYRNSELVHGPQAAGQTSSPLGLDAIYVVSDFTATDGDVSLNAALDFESNLVTFSWERPGRVFQMFRASNVNGPWGSLGPVFPTIQYDTQCIDGLSDGLSFYRIRQW